MADNPAKLSGRNELDDKPNSPEDTHLYIYIMYISHQSDNDYDCILAYHIFGIHLPI
jgi:hypothetical protein